MMSHIQTINGSWYAEHVTEKVTDFRNCKRSCRCPRKRTIPGDTMLIGYMRVSKADGSQVLDLQRDALLVPVSIPSTFWRHGIGEPGRAAWPGPPAWQERRHGRRYAPWWPKLDRLGRNVHLINTVAWPRRPEGVGMSTDRTWSVDQRRSPGRTWLGVSAWLLPVAGFERELVSNYLEWDWRRPVHAGRNEG